MVARKDLNWDCILVPLDGSPAAENILPTLKVLCRRLDARAVLARVSSALPSPDAPLARLYLERIADGLAQEGIETEQRVISGPISAGLIALAVDQRAALIAMATHGRLTPSEVPLGEVADQLLRSSPVPVLAVPARHPDVVDLPDLRRILVVIDGSDRSDSIIPTAAEFAARSGAEVVLLQITPAADSGRGDVEVRVDAEDHLDRLLVAFEQGRVPTDCLIKGGDPAETILEVAAEWNAGLIALDPCDFEASQGAAVGGVARELFRRADLPLLLPPARIPVAAAGRRRLPR